MKRHWMPFAAGCMICTSSLAIDVTQPTTSNFDLNADGWTGNATWYSFGGNPGGVMVYPGNVGIPAPTDIVAPSKYLGDWSPLNGIGYIQFDHRLVSLGSDINGYYPYSVALSGPGGSARWIGATPSAPTPWLTFQVPISSAIWSIESGDWNSILSNVTSFRIRIELIGNATILADTDAIDNVLVSAVPEPNRISLSIAGLGAIAWFAARSKGKRRSSPSRSAA